MATLKGRQDGVEQFAQQVLKTVTEASQAKLPGPK
jgi:hypothetical protein